MALSDWADTQIVAVGSALSLVMAAVITAAKRDSKALSPVGVASPDGGKRADSVVSSSASIVLDAAQIRQILNLSDQIGLLTMGISRLNTLKERETNLLERNNTLTEDNIRLLREAAELWRANTAAAIALSKEAEDLGRNFRDQILMQAANAARGHP